MPSKPPPPDPFSESDRQRLDELLREKELSDWLREKRERAYGRIKAVTLWLAAVAAFLSVLKDAFGYILRHLKEWLSS